MSLAPPHRIAKAISAAISVLVALLLLAVATVAIAQTPTVITNPAIGVFTGGINITARIDSATISGVVITVTKTSGTFGGNGVMRLCRGEGNFCETVVDAPYTAGAASVTLPAFTPRLRRQDLYYVQRYDAVTIGGLGPNVRSAQMIVIADNAEAGRKNAVQLTVGGNNCVLTTSSAVECWSLSALTPSPIGGLPANVTKIVGDGGSGCALAGGGVRCWGNNAEGQLGDGTQTSRSSTAAPVLGISGVVTDIAMGQHFACAMTGTTAWCWGANGDGQVSANGQITPTNQLMATAVPSLLTDNVQLALNYFGGCTLKASGAILCWGTNTEGQVGSLPLGRTVFPATPVSGLFAASIASEYSAHHVCAVKTDAKTWCWGANGSGQLGRGSISSGQPTVIAATLSFPNSVRTIIGGDSTCSMLLGNSLACWGDNTWGQLGLGTKVDYVNTPTVSVLTSQLALGVAGNVVKAAMTITRMCVVLDDGSVKCAGRASLGDASVNNASGFVSVLGYGPPRSLSGMPALLGASRTGDLMSLIYADNVLSGSDPLVSHRWACRLVGQSTRSFSGEAAVNDASGMQHTVQAYLVGVGPWECQVMYRTQSSYSAWSPWFTATARPTAVPTMISAVYDGSFGTLVFQDNSPATQGPIVELGAYCEVAYATKLVTNTPGCYQDNVCTLLQSVSESANARHTIRLPLPPSTAGVSSVQCRAGYSTNAGGSENAMALVVLSATPTPPPTINSGRVIGNTGTLTYSDNLPVAGGTVTSTAYSCTRTRDGAVQSGAVATNEPAGGTHTIALPLNSTDFQQNPDSYSCTVRVATNGPLGPSSTAYTIGPNSPPVISAFTFSASNGVISGSFNITDFDGDLVKNLMVYFGTSARGTDCTSGVLGSWDVPRAGGTINFTASATNVGCAALTSSATTIYGFVRGSDANGRDATIVDAQASNTPWVPPPPPTANDTYRIDFVSAPTTLNVDQAVDISLRLVDWNSTTVTAFTGRVCISLDVTNLSYSFTDDEADNHGTACRIVVMRNGVGRIRAFRMHAPGTVTILARAELPSTLAGAGAGSLANLLKAAATTSAATKTATGTLTVTAGATNLKEATVYLTPCNSDVVGTLSWRAGLSAFCNELAAGSIIAKAVDNVSGVTHLLSYASITLSVGTRPYVRGALPVSNFVVRFYRASAPTTKLAVKQPLALGMAVEQLKFARPEHLPYETSSGKRPVLLVHGVFDSTAAGNARLATAGDGDSATFDIPYLPSSTCTLSTAYESGFTPVACADLRKSNATAPNWIDLERYVQNLSTNYFVIPINYDWRMRPQDSASTYLAKAVAEAKRMTGSPVVDIVAHSMGGLVALSYVQTSNDVDRLIMLGTPIGGSVNAFGLMELADPIGLDRRMSKKLSGQDWIPNTYTWLVQNVFAQQRGAGIIQFDLGVNTNTYVTAYSTVASRAPLFRELVPSGFSLYPDSDRLKFLKTDNTPSASRFYWWSRRIGSEASSATVASSQLRWGDRGVGRPDYEGLFGGTSLADRAQCVQNSGARTSVGAGAKTSVYLFLSSEKATLRSLMYPQTLNDDATRPMRQNLAMTQFGDSESNWAWGDGTVPLDGQLDSLKYYLGVASAANICTKLGNVGGAHAKMPGNAQAQAYVRNILTGLGGEAAISAAPPGSTGILAKAVVTPTTQLAATYGNPTANMALADVATGASITVTASGATGTLVGASGSNSDGRVAASVTDPTGSLFTVQVSGGNTQGTVLRRVQFDAVGTVGETHDQRWLLVDKQTQHFFSLAFSGAAANPLTVTHAAPAAPTWVRTQPGAVTTLVKWQQPLDATIVRYEIHTRRANEEVWRLDAIVASSLTQNALPFGASSSTQPERLITVVAVNASGVRSRVADIASNVLVLTPEFSFEALAVVPPPTVANSNSSMGKNNAPIAISITGGQYSVNGGAWLATQGTLQPYDSVQLRGTAPATLDATQAVVFTANGVPYTFTVKAVNAIACKRPVRGVADSGPFIRFLDGLTGVSMVTGFVPAAESTSAAATNLENYFMDNLTAYDFNGDGLMSADVDGLLYARYALGFRGAGLVSGIAVGTARTTAQIETALAACQ